jgi:peroxiredoxin
MPFKRFVLAAALVTTAVAARAQEASTPLSGLWDAVVVVNKVEIPFRFEIGSSGSQVTGAFFDGEVRLPSTSGTLQDGSLTLHFDQYGSRLEATFSGGTLEGQYDRGTRGAPYPFRAQRAAPRGPFTQAPSIAGIWKIPTRSSKGEEAWRFIARQWGADVSASILRVDGDTGTLSGTYQDGKFVLSHFSGARPLLLEVSLMPDGTLELLQNGQTRLTAVHTSDPKSAQIPEPTDPSAHTKMKDPSAPFTFRFPDVNGRMVANTDPRFAGKVVIVSITGSWCPNCHDEAPFHAELYRKYRSQGLEIVALSFEEAAQFESLARLRGFVKQYGIDYTVLLAGEPSQLNERVPQADNLNAFPTTFFIGRDGLVRSIHAGFPSPASGEFYTEAKDELSREIERLLAEPAPARRTSRANARAASDAPRPTASRATSPHINLVASIESRNDGTSYDVIVDVTPHAGIHVYAPAAIGYSPVTLTVSPATGVSTGALTYPDPEDYYFKPLDEHVAVYQKPFRISQRVILDRAAIGRLNGMPLTLSGTLSYQACDDRLCYKPERVPLSWTIAAPARATK